VLAADGFGNVRTYIQSGNALVDSDLPAREVEKRVRALIRAHIGAVLAVMVRTQAQVQDVLQACPFYDYPDPSRIFFVLLSETPDAGKVAAVLAQDYGEEALAIRDDVAYMVIPGTYGRTRLSSNYLEKKLGVPATMRNLNTMRKMVELSG
jgi:uncharacterized protein (DUF1697 family)